MKKKVIVTGGLGFIGSNLIELLLNKSYQVINIDKNTYSSNFYNVKEFLIFFFGSYSIDHENHSTNCSYTKYRFMFISYYYVLQNIIIY